MPTRKTIIKTDEFKKWLREKHRLSSDVATDNASRAKRVAKWVRFDLKMTEAEIVDLMKARSGGELNPVIQCQLKRAVRLYREFSRSDFWQ